MRKLRKCKKTIIDRFYEYNRKVMLKNFPLCVRSGLIIGVYDKTFFILHEHLTRQWEPNRQGQFDRWMRGQTILPFGCYAGDVERFLRKLPVVD